MPFSMICDNEELRGYPLSLWAKFQVYRASAPTLGHELIEHPQHMIKNEQQ